MGVASSHLTLRNKCRTTPQTSSSWTQNPKASRRAPAPSDAESSAYWKVKTHEVGTPVYDLERKSECIDVLTVPNVSNLERGTSEPVRKCRGILQIQMYPAWFAHHELCIFKQALINMAWKSGSFMMHLKVCFAIQLNCTMYIKAVCPFKMPSYNLSPVFFVTQLSKSDTQSDPSSALMQRFFTVLKHMSDKRKNGPQLGLLSLTVQHPDCECF